MQKSCDFFFLLFTDFGLVDVHFLLPRTLLFLVLEKAVEHPEEADALVGGMRFPLLIDAVVHATHMIRTVILHCLTPPFVVPLKAVEQLP